MTAGLVAATGHCERERRRALTEKGTPVERRGRKGTGLHPPRRGHGSRPTEVRDSVRRVLFAFDHHRALHAEHGQMAVALAAVMILFGVAGFLAIDVGFWYADRRDAQSDADFAAMAGALELPDFHDDAGASTAADLAARQWAAGNDVDPSTVTVEVVDNCFSANDEVHTGVRVTIARTPQSPFVGLFSSFDPEIGASAVACSGSPAEMIGFMPWALEVTGDCFQDDPLDPGARIPIYGQRCDIVVGGQGSETGNVGQLGFADPGGCNDGDSDADAYEQAITNGVSRICGVGDSVVSNPGVNVGKTRSGLAARLGAEGLCATTALSYYGEVVANTTNFNLHPVLVDLLHPDLGGIDDFFEVWGPSLGYDVSKPAERIAPFDCDAGVPNVQTSPRNVVVIMINDLGTDDGSGCTGEANSHCYAIRGFARMYVEGCSSAQQGFRARCDIGGGGGSFSIHARFVESVGLSSGRLQLSRFGDIQTFLKE
jgi:Flp pilus assembly protein TadG